MSTKHVFNSTDDLVLRSLRGAVALNPSLKLHSASKSVYVALGVDPLAIQTRSASYPAVAVISGGGAGHEPAHAGYTGRGMLAASVSGDVFASPSAKQIFQTIHLASLFGATASGTGQDSDQPYRDVLVIINNYTGDRLNFGLAIEKALASSRMKIESVVVADDVSLLRPASESGSQTRKSLVGARGLGGNILVCKILGAFAESGANLARVKCLGDAVVHNLASVAVGLEHCHVPGRAISDAMKLKDDECEIGLGLHNEPGVTRKPMEGPEGLVEELLGLIMRSREGNGDAFLRLPEIDGEKDTKGDKVVLLVNNLGGISQLETGAAVDEVIKQLADVGVYPARVYSSTYMTSLNAPGFSISLLNVSAVYRQLESSPDWDADVDILNLLDEPTEAYAWVGARTHWPMKPLPPHARLKEETAVSPSAPPPIKGISESQAASDKIKHCITSACLSVLSHEKNLTDFDTILGDGDCGQTFAAGAKAIYGFVKDENANVDGMTVYELTRCVGEVLEDNMGGTIGALFAIFFTAVSAALTDIQQPPTSRQWGEVLTVGLKALEKHTPAKPGDRTLIDALSPFCIALSRGNTLEQAVEAARIGAESTRSMQAVLGRAAYVNVPRDASVLPPDPGAWGVLAIVEGLSRGLSGSP
ncbi:putative dak2 [Lyophyllum shimeji]|uniref:Dak2 n=1 Tax=Lyophyllum shimeji TaxID=47721 RepID=A0A9P3PPI6_LYOSH|nr:putative dak2 [Lyophyllum shimeji]